MNACPPAPGNAGPALVTGATGFVGSAVVRQLATAGVDVRALVRAGADTGNLAGLPPVELRHGDLTDAASLRAAVRGCRGVFHVAADYRLWAPDPTAMYAVNVTGTRDLLLAAAEAGVERIVYTSSVATLGTREDGSPADERTPVTFDEMIGHYKKSKFLAEDMARRLAADNGVPAVIVNPSAPLGPRDRRPTPTGRIILDAASGRMPAYMDTGLNVVHVDDVAAGHLLAFRHGVVGERYILGGEDMTLRDILTRVAALAGRTPPRLRLSQRALEPVARASELWARISGREPLLTVDGLRLSRKHMYFTSERARRELGYHSRPAAQAIADAVEWYRAEGYLGGRRR